MYYDPMIAKLITHGATREAAIAHMRRCPQRVLYSRRVAQYQLPGGTDRASPLSRGAASART